MVKQLGAKNEMIFKVVLPYIQSSESKVKIHKRLHQMEGVQCQRQIDSLRHSYYKLTAVRQGYRDDSNYDGITTRCQKYVRGTEVSYLVGSLYLDEFSVLVSASTSRSLPTWCAIINT